MGEGADVCVVDGDAIGGEIAVVEVSGEVGMGDFVESSLVVWMDELRRVREERGDWTGTGRSGAGWE